MSFRLKDAGSTYQRMATRMFEDQLGRNMEAYIDDMVVKSKQIELQLGELSEIFRILRKHCLRLNASKCAFGVGLGKFLGYLITHQGIEVNPDQIEAIHRLNSLRNPKEIQRLTGMATTLNCFISRLAEQCRPFFQLLKKWKDYHWTLGICGSIHWAKRILGKSLITFAT